MLRLPSKSSFTLSKLRFWSLHKPWTLLFIHPQQKEDDSGHSLFYLFLGLNESGLRVIFFQRIFNVKKYLDCKSLKINIDWKKFLFYQKKFLKCFCSFKICFTFALAFGKQHSLPNVKRRWSLTTFHTDKAVQRACLFWYMTG